jgi:Mn2+/Fe2+ NRAMP family transporter
MPNLLWAIIVIIAILWILGFSFHLAGGFVHILLVLVVIAIVARLILGRPGI